MPLSIFTHPGGADHEAHRDAPGICSGGYAHGAGVMPALVVDNHKTFYGRCIQRTVPVQENSAV